MSISGKASAIKETIKEIYSIFSDKEESSSRDEEFSERIKHDKKFEDKIGKVIQFPRKNDPENRDISAI